MSSSSSTQRSGGRPDRLSHPDRFVDRHIGPRPSEIAAMLAALHVASLDDLIDRAVPAAIRRADALALPPALSEAEATAALQALANRNVVARSYLGQGYHDCILPAVIRRNVLENPGWYTQYTPYQAEISQGRLEGLLAFQTLVGDLTGLPVANASMLDEATAAAEAMGMCVAARAAAGRRRFLVARDCHPQTISVVATRAEGLGIELAILERGGEVGDDAIGVLLQYPASDGAVLDPAPAIASAHAHGALAVVACDLLALTLLAPPGERGADIAVGSAQRLGVPLGFGGPHAGFLATREELKRQLPGRIVGVSKDVHGARALRLALQTREQHIRREKATSNICTAQALLANIAAMYAIYHGPQGLQRIASRIHRAARALQEALARLGFSVPPEPVFDTALIGVGKDRAALFVQRAERAGINIRAAGGDQVVVALDETVGSPELDALIAVFAEGRAAPSASALAEGVDARIPAELARATPFLAHPLFNRYHSETEMLRYLRHLEGRDLSLAHAMIPLGSCTMKLNASAEMLPITWPNWAQIHPFAPAHQTEGYQAMIRELERWLCAITGFEACSLQPNAGSQGEFAGLLAIRHYHRARGQGHRKACLIPTSAHGTNPASAAMCGLAVVPVACNAQGDVDLADLASKARAHAGDLACMMVTYPSTHGVFEQGIREACRIVHASGGQVYMDGANMNAQVGLCSPGDLGADICHLNLHKTFCIPHGGGGPGMGPILCRAHLAGGLPGHPAAGHGARADGAVSAAPWGSALILPIPWMYIAMMGADGLTQATRVAILAANYVARRLAARYPVLYAAPGGWVAHECILDVRGFKASAGIEVEDVAKRLMDYGFHAPTVSFPVPGTLMIEPTESEGLAELDRFCDAMIAIHGEIQAIVDGKSDRADNPLKHAPHTMGAIASDAWTHPYTRMQAAFPTAWTRERKFWPAVGRIDSAYGDRNLVCSCPPMEAYGP